MEAGLYFSFLVAGACLFHLISKAAACIEDQKGVKKKKQQDVRRKSVQTDWYMFFYRADISNCNQKKSEEINRCTKKQPSSGVQQSRRPSAPARLHLG